MKAEDSSKASASLSRRRPARNPVFCVCMAALTLAAAFPHPGSADNTLEKIGSLIRAFMPREAFSGDHASKLAAWRLEAVVHLRPGEPQQFAGYLAAAQARLLNANPTSMPPEDACRQLEGLADEIGESGSPDSRAASRIALFYSRRISAAWASGLFIAAGDAVLLQTAQAQASAAASLFDRLGMLPQEAVLPAMPGWLLPGSAVDCRAVLHYDIAQLTEAESLLKRYGLLDLGLDFGAGPTEQYCARAPRLFPFGPADLYDPRKGFGWLETEGIASSPQIQPPDFGLLTGGRRRETPQPPQAFSGGFLRGRSRARLRLDLPDGSYRITSIVRNQAEMATGSFLITAAGEADNAGGRILYSAGEAGEKTMNAEAHGGMLLLGFKPQEGSDWLVGGLTVTRRIPHFGHLPLRKMEEGLPVLLHSTITAPEEPVMAEVCIVAGGRSQIVPLVPEGLNHSARISLDKNRTARQAEYYFRATDAAGHSARWPATGSFPIEVSGPR
jgi:hypothetical protein